MPDIGAKSAASAESAYAERRSETLSQSLEDCQKDALVLTVEPDHIESKGIGRLVDVAISLVKVFPRSTSLAT